MSYFPHPDHVDLQVACGVVTISDTRTPETDRSGQTIQQMLQVAGHTTAAYLILKDDPRQIRETLQGLTAQPELAAVILNGGTGIASRDTTYDAIAKLLDKQLPGFGELFRWLSYQEIGSRAIASRALAGIYRSTVIFSLPGSTHAVQLAMEKLILPELTHLVGQLRA